MTLVSCLRGWEAYLKSVVAQTDRWAMTATRSNCLGRGGPTRPTSLPTILEFNPMAKGPVHF